MEFHGAPREQVRSLKQKPTTTIRVNNLKISKEEIITKLEKKGFIIEEHPLSPQALKVKKQPFSIGATTEYLQGYYIIQDAASQLAVNELGPRPGESVLDMAAGPGAKTTHLSDLMNNQGLIIACDTNKKRLLSVKYNAQRMGCENIIGLNIDSRRVNDLEILYDRVLIDAPCTALGTLYKNKGLEGKELPIKRLRRIQLGMIETGIKVLRPGGTMVYSTCTVTKQENEDVVKHAINQGMKIEPLRIQEGIKGLDGFNEARRLSPGLTDTQGFFIAKLVKT